MARPHAAAGLAAVIARRAQLLALAGTSVVLSTASLAGSGLALLSDAACRNGDWVRNSQVFQNHCYSDLYSLYGAEAWPPARSPISTTRSSTRS